MRLNAEVKVNWKNREFEGLGARFAQEVANAVGQTAKEYARRNVSPGYGPGPHPHRIGSEHEDTGDLMRSIRTQIIKEGFLRGVRLYTDLDYGLYLEMGWTNPWSGNHWRYPWLYPALWEAQHEWASLAKTYGYRYFSETGTSHPRSRRVAITSPLSGTWLPE